MFFVYRKRRVREQSLSPTRRTWRTSGATKAAENITADDAPQFDRLFSAYARANIHRSIARSLARSSTREQATVTKLFGECRRLFFCISRSSASSSPRACLCTFFVLRVAFVSCVLLSERLRSSVKFVCKTAVLYSFLFTSNAFFLLVDFSRFLISSTRSRA